MADDDNDKDVEGSSLSAVIADEISQAQTFDQGKRTLALEYMRGEMSDVPQRPNGSQQTSRDLADVMAWMLPGVMRVFASERVVEFEATQEGGEKGAEEATEYINYSFLRENPGYQVIYNATYDSLLMGNGAACSYWMPEVSETKLFRDKTDMELAELRVEEGWEPTGIARPGKPKPDLIEDPMTGDVIEIEVPTTTTRLKKVKSRGQICDMTLKPENLLLSGSATTIEGARFCAYLHDDKTRSDLIEMAEEYGWDEEVIDSLPAYSTTTDTSGVATARNPNAMVRDNPNLHSGDRIDLYECYIRVDEDDDGIAELLQVWYAGRGGQGAVLSFDEWDDDIPFTDIPCYPVPHRWEAESVYDRMADIQRVKTVLLRQGLDNTYAVNMPMREVEAGSVLNPEIMVSPKFNGLMWKKPGSAPIIPHVIPYVADKVFAAMEYMDTMTAKRTGVSRTTMALDPEALQNQTATASQNQRDAGYSQNELVARNMAELGWTKFFGKRRNLAKKYIKEPVKIPSKNGDAPPPPMPGKAPGEPSKYRTIQPETWSDDMACTINVGLGTGSRDRDMAMLNNILNGQIGMADRLAQMGMKPKAIEFIRKIRKTAVEIAESSGLKNPDSYYPDFTEDELKAATEAAQQPQPDPAVQLEQMKQQGAKELKGVDAQVTMQVEQGKNQLAQQQAVVDSEAAVRREQAQLEADMMTSDRDRENAMAIEAQKIASAERIRAAELQFEREKFTKTQALESEKFSATMVLEHKKLAHASVMADANNAARAEMAKTAAKNKPNGKQPNA